MTKYKLDPNLDWGNQHYAWKGLFSGLSIQRFDRFDYLDLPIEPSETLRRICHDYALTRTLVQNISEYEKAIDRLVSKPNPDYLTYNFINADKLDVTTIRETSRSSGEFVSVMDILFTNTFLELEKYGYAEILFDWGQQTRIYLKHNQRSSYNKCEVLKAVFHLLRKWAVTRWVKQAHDSSNQEWDNIIEKYSPIYFDPPNPGFDIWHPSDINLPETTKQEIMTLVLRYQAQQLWVETTVEEIESSYNDKWEQFALRAGTVGIWIEAESRHRLNLKAWKLIDGLLNLSEKSVLNDWILEHKEYFDDIESPLPDFTTILN